MRALVLEHEPDAPAGHLGDVLAQRGVAVEVHRPRADPAPPVGEFDLVVALGSEAAAYDDAIPWVPGVVALLRGALAARVPVLGICFGAQALARALGAEVRRADRPEIGWYEIATDDPALVPAGPWLQWHYDTFAVPDGALELARSAAAPQAYAGREGEAYLGSSSIPR